MVEDTLLTAFVATIGATPTKDQICEWTDVPHAAVERAVAELKRRLLIRHLGAGHWGARQCECARSGREVRGRAVQVDPETLRWFCADCWDREVAAVRRLVHGE